jgi:amidase
MADELARLDASAQAELVARGEVSPAELVDAAIARIEQRNPELGAVITPLYDEARQAAAGELPDGPFRGVPFLMKDIGASVAGAPFHAGMRFLKERGFRTPRDSFYTEKIRDAGFVICGKTNTPELGILPTTEPAAYPPARNPHDLARSTGGSSGGSAAAVATGMVPVAHANDGGGSIRIPASCCGLVGLKPSRGRVSLGPDLGAVNGGLVAEHVVARSVRDSARLLDCLAGAMPGDPYAAPPQERPYADEVGRDPGRLRVGFSTRFINPQGQVTSAHPDCVAAVADAARLLEDLGCAVEERHIDALEDPNYVPRFLAIWAAGVTADLESWSAIAGTAITADDVEPLTWALGEMGKSVTSASYINAWAWLEHNARKVAAWFQEFDLYLTPTVATPPPPLGSFDVDPAMALMGIFKAAEFAPFTPPFNATGQPGISLPLSRNGDGLPIGVQLVAAYGREDLLLRVAAALEQARPFEHAATM